MIDLDSDLNTKAHLRNPNNYSRKKGILLTEVTLTIGVRFVKPEASGL